MPLDKSGKKSAIGYNIKAEMSAGKPQKQAVAIALDVQRRAGGAGAKPKAKKHAHPKVNVRRAYPKRGGAKKGSWST